MGPSPQMGEALLDFTGVEDLVSWLSDNAR
ncbi:DUF4351 domain-containing protein [Roseofilum capinflatum]